MAEGQGLSHGVDLFSIIDSMLAAVQDLCVVLSSLAGTYLSCTGRLNIAFFS